ncbi:MAG: AraC family transcriptional regulator [Gemmatimonadetes bacterium]|nr:AraC family transcriptional regulator [Gemmatimonadota bacterium]MDA1102683.1 AraC family transcriptional regulator [Gemmatimonadota bacterium]
MIVVQVNDTNLRRALCRAAHAEEDVIIDARLAASAIESGFPRLVVRMASDDRPAPPARVTLLEIDELMLRRWEVERRSAELPMTRLDYMTRRLAGTMDRSSAERTWVDRALADLAKSAGPQLPLPLRSFARRILEFPVHYTTLHAVAEASGTSRGALKARFRRRGLSSPYTYLRWFRIMAVANLLSDRSITVAVAAQRMGFTSDGNLCRMMANVTGMTPTEARTLRGWNRLLIGFAWTHLPPGHLEGWASLDDLFARRVA